MSTSSTGSEWEEAGLPPSLNDFERAQAMLWTPKSLRVGPLLDALVDTSPSDGAALETIGELAGPPEGVTMAERDEYARDALLVIIDEWSRVKNNFELLN
jgi:hypothetical protein